MTGDDDRGHAVTDEPRATRATLLEMVRDSADAAAWARFEATYRDMLVRFARSRGLQQADAEDVVQAVFAKLVAGLRRFEYDRGKGRFRDYLFRCVRSAIADLRGCPTIGPSPVVRDGGTSGDDEALEREWVGHHYRRAISEVGRTSEAASVAVFESLLRGLSVREAAREAGMSEEAVYKVQQRMRERLRAQIEKQVREEDEGAA
jgi:RNA polymerase sigma-70 factor (ECF subfamily)